MIVQILTFMAVANPATFKFVRGIAGNWVSNSEGRATTAGLFLHALVFVFLAGFLMRLLGPVVSRYDGADIGSDDAASPAPSPSPDEVVPRDYSNLFDSILAETGMKNFAN